MECPLAALFLLLKPLLIIITFSQKFFLRRLCDPRNQRRVKVFSKKLSSCMHACMLACKHLANTSGREEIKTGEKEKKRHEIHSL